MMGSAWCHHKVGADLFTKHEDEKYDRILENNFTVRDCAQDDLFANEKRSAIHNIN